MTDSIGYIRPATLEDIPNISACASAAYELYVERIGKIPAPMQADFSNQLNTHTIDVVEDQGVFVGYVVHQNQGNQTLLENVAVLPQFSGCGFGRVLINHVEQSALDNGTKKVVLYTNEAMIENLRLYPKLGYIETGKIIEDGFIRVYFEKYV